MNDTTTISVGGEVELHLLVKLNPWHLILSMDIHLFRVATLVSSPSLTWSFFNLNKGHKR